MSTEMDIDPTIERIAHEVLDEYDQSEAFKKRFLKFYENAVQGGLGLSSLEELIEDVELPEGVELDGA
ncbi:hypothetical protein SAMN04487948_1457 [Halogranum amylolyticum]|uniref:Uncharacterized protein n=1 Tax=Halogranum amylolyticum TaxID=660520 RepID=A0A1H8WUV0_9EURY|nr:CxC ATPase DNA modification system associated small protein [Halogranum amylolyticum]SEP31435.1 hypothetical protein SAMN04487948_1457 [Halogranum amylolyticum]